MKIDYSRKSKVSFLLSTMLLGAVSLSASNENYIQELNLVSGNSYTNSTPITQNKVQAPNADVLTAGIKLSNLPDTSSNSPTSLTNNAKIDLKSTGGEEVSQIGVLAGKYNYDEDKLPSTPVNFLELTNNKNIVISTSSDYYADSVGVFSYNIQGNSKLINNGNIDVFAKSNGDATDAVGIVLGDFGGDIKNSKNASIKAVSEGNKLSAAFGISAVSSEGGSLVNEGSINVSAKAKDVAFGVATEFWGFWYGKPYSLLEGGSFSNSGTINAVAQSDKYAVASGLSTDALVEDSTIINSGVISSNAVSKDVKKAFAYGLVGSELVNSTITNSGTIEAKVNGKLNNQGFSLDYEDTSGSKITNEKTGKLYGNIYLGDNGQFVNKGFVSLPYNANVLNTIQYLNDDGKPDGTRKGAVYISNLVNSGTIEIGAYKDSEGNIENTQILAKTATFEKGSKMQVDVVAGSKAFVKGDTLSEVVTATDKLTINDLTLNQTKLADNSATLDFKYEVKDGKRIDLVVSKVNSFQEAGNTQGNATNVAQVLNKLRTDPNLGRLVAKLDAEADLNRALDTLTPTIAAAISNTSSQISTSVLNVVSSRNRLGANSGDEMVLGNSTLWSKVYGSLGEQKEKDGINGFDLKTYGLGLGYENEYKDGQLLGTGLFYTNANVDINGVSQKTDVDAYSLALYGNNLLKDNKTTIYYQGAYTWQKNDSKRDLFDGTQANAKFTTKILSLDLGVGHKININESLHMEPKLGVTYKHYSNPNYSETGSSANLTTNKFTSSELLGNAELNMGYKINDFSKITALAGVGYDFKNDNNIVTSSFSAAPSNSFDTKGIDNGRWKYVAGLGYDVDVNNQNNINLSYNFQGEGSKYTNHGLALNYRYKF
ncbi:autotransporter outer membrane beta-barrel domain-containing protein [Aliarcobacter cryaerophilus]|uniref:autotransporter outer membrane beta-barrel domain-containing protein n=1 Tax=Aliarcobacter cryaerophilus TaxID=28198 RepID=UPI0021B5964E|nr:autotransporter outer membrane beta-barrel domain-containing protein [Aliarcobacter cryaerophilus]MCT7405065.1 autotransporter domain-containing protein [Aliarcobacter cryaerophilus]MCT7502894.1 autotransporter domain-containing protein [Aliarcobacter cryaerophilus]